MCTIADAKVPLGSAAWLVQELNHNCYNMYFYECLRYIGINTNTSGTTKNSYNFNTEVIAVGVVFH